MPQISFYPQRDKITHGWGLSSAIFLLFQDFNVLFVGREPKRGKFPAEDCWIDQTLLAPVHRLKCTGYFNDSGCGFIFLFHTPKRRVVVGGFIFCHFFAFPGFQMFCSCGARTQKGQVSSRELWDISHIACTGTLTKTHWVFQCFRLWLHFFYFTRQKDAWKLFG